MLGRFLLRCGVTLTVLSSRGIAQQDTRDPERVVRSAERALQDDSLEQVSARWRAALERDGNDPAAVLGLATIARQTYDFERAERLLSGLLARAGGRADGWTVRARLGLYRVANARGEVRRADSLLRLAMADARRLNDRPAQVAALIGFTNTRSGTPAALYATLDSALALLPAGESRDRAEYLCRRGLYRGVAGEHDGTFMVRQGIAMAERLGERQLTGHCLEADGLLQSLRSHDDSALATMSRAESLLRATHEHAGLARVASRRSDILQSSGRLGEAKVALEQVMAGAKLSRNAQRLGNGYGGLGMLALRVGDLPSAAANFARAAAISDSVGLTEGSLIARQNTGEVLAASGDLDAARATFLDALERATRGDYFEDVVLTRQHLARVAIRQRAWDEAERQLASADSAAHAQGFEEMRNSIVYDRGRLALGRGDARGAVRHFTTFLGRSDPDDQLIRYTVRTRLAQARAAAGDLDGAERELDQAGADLERWRATLGAGELRRFAFAATALGEYDPQGPTSGVIAALIRGGRAKAAFTLAERRRARALADRLTQADALRETNTALAAHRDRPMVARDLAMALPDDRTALLEFVAGGENAPTTLFMVTRAGVEARLLPPADSLARPIERFAALLESGGPAEALSRSLGSMILGPPAAVLPDSVDRLIVVPDGPLHRLAFDALRLPDGQLALERWSIGLSPSAAVAAVLRRRAEADSASTPRLLALGDPTFPRERGAGTTRASELFRGAFDAAGGLPRLAASGDEARDVARYARDAEVRLRDEASEAWLKRTPIDRFRVIHLATHALVDENSLARTSLALAPGSGEDGFLSPADLSALKLRADLVVLSACRTAGGVMVTGEGLQGLTAPLIEAGARAVVATRWRINDRSTVRVVRDLYDALARGAPVAEALRAAKLAAVRRGAPMSEWAGFTVVGDPLVRVRLETPASPDERRWWVVGGIVLASVIALIYGRYGRPNDRRLERT
ncbi:MAG TPA: CHAT domain-containing protein [Gemmatimonadales bacterium]|nr:CHAT domain-containing protein [Gemmatimonadales bacterium]